MPGPWGNRIRSVGRKLSLAIPRLENLRLRFRIAICAVRVPAADLPRILQACQPSMSGSDCGDLDVRRPESDVLGHDAASAHGTEIQTPVSLAHDTHGKESTGETMCIKSEAANETHEPDVNIQLGQELATRISHSLDHANEVTERATLAVGEHIAKLFEIARRDNELASRSLSGMIGGESGGGERAGSEQGVAALVEQQRNMINAFTGEARRFFQRQIEMSEAAVVACREMERSVEAIERLVFSSKILAFNVQVESIRLGEQGRSFSVLGEEMVGFSTRVNQANTAIQHALSSVRDSMRRFHEESVAVDCKLTKYSEQLDERLEHVEQRTGRLTASLAETLERITSSNENLMSHSQFALSELQFQDPLAQELRRTRHEVEKLQSLLTVGSCEDTSLAELDATVGGDGTEFRESGTVELF